MNESVEKSRASKSRRQNTHGKNEPSLFEIEIIDRVVQVELFETTTRLLVE